MNKFYITTPIYYVNSRPHIGHAYTTVAADILARYNRLKLGDDNVWFLTGTDEHGAKIAQAAEKEGKEPLAFADEVSSEYREAWKALNIANDDFIRTTEERHEKNASELLTKLKNFKTPKGNDVLYKDKYEGLYCVGCESYKKDEDLVAGKCPDHGTKPQFLSEENWYFRLSDFSDVVLEQIKSNKIKIAPDGRKKEVLSFIEHGLEDVAISRQNLKWGIPLPFDKQQVAYVWIEALMNYISALGYPNDDKFKKFWPANTQLLGKDILKFHCIIWPAMLTALEIELPQELFVHGYFTIDGKKMSKTLGNVIDPIDLVDEFGADAARYLIVSQFQFGNDGDVKAEEFITKYNSDLANGVGNLVNRVLVMTDKYCGGKVPDKKFSLKKGDSIGFNFIEKFITEGLDIQMKGSSIYAYASSINQFVSACNIYIDEQKPWVLDKEGKREELESVIYNSLELIRLLAYSILPLLPNASKQLLHWLSQDDDLTLEDALEIGRLKPKTKVEKGAPLFLRKDAKTE